MNWEVKWHSHLGIDWMLADDTSELSVHCGRLNNTRVHRMGTIGSRGLSTTVLNLALCMHYTLNGQTELLFKTSLIHSCQCSRNVLRF